MEDNWISVKKKKPKSNKKFSESDYILCYAPIGGIFVGWYNSRFREWYVAHHMASSLPLSYDNIPTHWQPLPSPPKDKQ